MCCLLIEYPSPYGSQVIKNVSFKKKFENILNIICHFYIPNAAALYRDAAVEQEITVLFNAWVDKYIFLLKTLMGQLFN